MILAAVLIPITLFFAGIGWAAWWVIDNIGAPPPGPTGSGPCSSADAVDLQLISADGHTVRVCTRDRPACANHTVEGRTQFALNSQLRSSSRRYILYIGLDAALAAETAEQTVTLHPGEGFIPEGPVLSTITSAMVQVTPRDPYENGFVTVSGSLTVASSKGVARGRIDGSFVGPTRTDRPAPTPVAGSPVRVTGSFACNH
jgi:hypothetical protein